MTFDMYREIIIDHSKNPRNFGTLDKPDGTASAENPSCGDNVDLQYHVDAKKKVLTDIKFTGTGCSLTKAGASVLTEQVKGKSLKDIAGYTDDAFIADLGVPVTPARKKCALLALRTLREQVIKTTQ
ncbi:MAG: iron-sulfur cluster assembly scaffold protein [Candidatus Kerfeldbacteria bacterium]|nr:iron-sulfur cluster assembly scaffold protein [Candidatus Kerfeldbacteria bacterium]